MFVAGCHRSGTSYVSGLLSAAVGCVRPNDLDRTVDNPRGYFESTLMGPLNDYLLYQSGYSWDRPPLAPVYWNKGEYLLSVNERKSDFIGYATSSDWVDKDPRLCLTFPVYENLLLRRIPCLAVLRNPLDVATSLRLRDGFSIDKSLLIWYLYNRHCSLFLLEGVDQLVSYESLLSGIPSQLNRLYEFLWPALRARLDSEDLRVRISDACASLSDSSLRRNAGKVPDAGHPPSSSLLYDFCSAVYARIEHADFSLEAFKRSFSDLPVWLIDAYDRIFAEGEPSLEYLRCHDVKSRHLDRLGLSGSLHTGELEIDQQIISEFAGLIDSVHALKDQLSTISPDSQVAENSFHRIADLERQLLEIRSSSCWRLTAPLRKIFDCLRRG